MTSKKSILIICAILSLAAFTHIWNLTGYPEIFYDEGVYLRRASDVLEGKGPQEGIYYDHPYFGQFFLSGFFFITGYPNSVNPQPNPDSIESLFVVPRLIMGLIAVFDTFLVYKIIQKRYDTKIAIFTSAFFAVMPITWIMRRILLDSIILPFLLLAILFAVYSKDNRKFVLASGVCMGLAIFTKIPAFTMIPVVVYLIYSGTKSKKTVGLWLIPVLLLPLIWPAQSLVTGNFANHWIHDVLWQTQRNRIGLFEVTESFLAMDPILFVLGLMGIGLFAIKRDRLVLLWFIPYVVFLGMVGFVQYFHWMMLLPVFSLGLANFVDHVGKKIQKSSLMLTPFLGIAIFGLACTTLVISTNLTNTQFEATAFTATLAKENPNVAVFASPTYEWVLHDVLGLQNAKDYVDILYKKTPQQMIILSDPHFQRDFTRGLQLSQADALTSTITEYVDPKALYDLNSYPYSNLNYDHDAGLIQIKATKNN